MDYGLLKLIHLSCVVLSLGGFVTRFVLRLSASRLLRTRTARIVPHAVDTLLLVSAVAMVWMAWPEVPAWVRAKLFALVLYVLAGSHAIKRAQSPAGMWLSFGIAITVAIYIVAVALSKNPWPMALAHASTMPS